VTAASAALVLVLFSVIVIDFLSHTSTAFPWLHHQLTLSRSHKVTGDGLAQLLQAGRVRQLTLVRCKGVSKARLQQLRRHFPDVDIREDKREDESGAE
jgi:hypothetical protein